MLGVQDIGDDFAVSHRPCRPRRRAVQHTASVFCAVGAKAVDFQSPPIVQIPADRTANNSNAHNFLPISAANRKFMPHDWLVMPVVLLHKGVGC